VLKAGSNETAFEGAAKKMARRKWPEASSCNSRNREIRK